MGGREERPPQHLGGRLRIGLRFAMSAPAVALMLTTVPGPAAAATLPAGFGEQQVAGGLAAPTAMALAPDGRLFVAEQGGRLRLVKNGALLTTPFVNVAVTSTGERGLLGVALDPAFTTNNFVYVYYTAPSPVPHNRISRFTAAGDVAVAGSEQVITELDNLSTSVIHNGGAIHFGADGRLYAAVGDNANGANAQSLSNRLGKMLRINPDGSIPPDNPFAATAVGPNRAIWALGLRNPYTFAVQPGTGRIFINDVGQSTWEEIDDGTAGANFGWPETEGPTSDPRFRSPLFAYGHGDGLTTGCAITGGSFYNPSTAQFPADHIGDYFFADHCSGWIRRLDPASGTAMGFATGLSRPVDLQVGADGSLWYLTRGTGSTTGSVWRIDAAAVTSFPRSVTVTAGTLRSGDATRLTANDNRFLEVSSTQSDVRTAAWHATFAGVPEAVSDLEVTYAGKSSGTCSQTVAIHRWASATWEELDARNSGTTEVKITGLRPAGPLGDYVSDTGKVRVRLRCRSTTAAFVSSADLLKLVHRSP